MILVWKILCFHWKYLYSLTAKIDFSDLYSISRDKLIYIEEKWWTSYMELFPTMKTWLKIESKLPCQVSHVSAEKWIREACRLRPDSCHVKKSFCYNHIRQNSRIHEIKQLLTYWTLHSNVTAKLQKQIIDNSSAFSKAQHVASSSELPLPSLPLVVWTKTRYLLSLLLNQGEIF